MKKWKKEREERKKETLTNFFGIRLDQTGYRRSPKGEDLSATALAIINPSVVNGV